MIEIYPAMLLLVSQIVFLFSPFSLVFEFLSQGNWLFEGTKIDALNIYEQRTLLDTPFSGVT